MAKPKRLPISAFQKASGPNRPGLFCLCLLFFLFQSSCSKSISSDELQKLAGSTMGTTYSVSFYYTDTAKPEDNIAIKKQLDARLENIEQSMSTYREDSELSRFNQSEINQWFETSDALLQVLSQAQKVSQLSQGGFDITVGPLVNIWGFGPKFTADSIPDTQAIQSIIDNRLGYQFLHIDLEKRRIKKEKALYLDLSAIAKGYAVDELALILESRGIHSYLVEIGGELKASGYKAGGKPWKVAVEKPVLDRSGEQRVVQSVLALTDMAIASSGDYRNFFEKDGKFYSHTINPKTGMPLEHQLASVTVLHESCILADALATAFMVMGEERTLEFASKEDIAVLLLLRNEDGFQEMVSPSMKGKLLN